MVCKYGTNLIGIRSLSVNHSVDAITTVNMEIAVEDNFDTRQLLNTNWKDFFPGNAVVKCKHCGCWAAAQTTCVHCGGRKQHEIIRLDRLCNPFTKWVYVEEVLSSIPNIRNRNLEAVHCLI